MKKSFLLSFLILSVLNSFSQYLFDKVIIYDTINFDYEVHYQHFSDTILFDTSATNIWQIGQPQKTIFNSTTSGENAIITDTINTYPVNCNSSFTILITQPDGWYSPFNNLYIEFKHKFDTDLNQDGGYIDVSYDNGENWVNIINDTIGEYNWWILTPISQHTQSLYTTDDVLYNGNYGFSGNIEDWEIVQFGWNIQIVKDAIDTMLVRFNFISDDIDNEKEGWIIDDIILFGVDLGGTISENTQKRTSIYPNPVENNSVISFDKNYSSIKIELYNSAGQIVKKDCILNSNIYNLSKNELQSGIYFLKITLDNRLIENQKIIIH